MPITEPDGTERTVTNGLDGGKGAFGGGLGISVSHTSGGKVDGRYCECCERFPWCGEGRWAMSMTLLDMWVGHDLRVWCIALLCDLWRNRA
jgi:hypothetical protein